MRKFKSTFKTKRNHVSIINHLNDAIDKVINHSNDTLSMITFETGVGVQGVTAGGARG